MTQFHPETAAPKAIRLAPQLARLAATAGIVALCAVLLHDRFTDLRADALWNALTGIAPGALVVAFALGLLSHLALAGYDMLAFPRIGRRVPWPRALRGGFAGTVLSQVLGFGLITGSFARRRIYRANGIHWPQAVALSGFVAAGFFLGVAMILALLLLADPAPAMTVLGAEATPVRIAAAGFLTVMAVLSVARLHLDGQVRLGPLDIHLPDGRWLAGATLLALADLVPAALCLHVLLPAEDLPGLAAFVAAYVAAVALGHLAGSPGAVGPFEAVMLLALPAMPVNELAAGILAYRAVYYLPPFIMALGFVLRAARTPGTPLLTGAALTDRIAWIADESSQPEAELAKLGDKHIYCPDSAQGFIQYGLSGRIFLMMGDPVGPEHAWPDLISGLAAEARAQGATLVAYKATRRTLPLWRGLGYRLDPLGAEGSVDTTAFTLDGPERRELRRKCRAAAKAGVTLARHTPGTAPLDAMASVAMDWKQAKNGREQTFSMGHWEPDFVSRHPAVSAWQDDRLIAFATLWPSGDGREWMLDLMRQAPEVPNGTMHALIACAVDWSADHGAERFNLCMAPLSGLAEYRPASLCARIGHLAYTRLDRHHGLIGLRRFKDIFRPDWEYRYLAAPDPAAAVAGMLVASQLVAGRGTPDAAIHPRCPFHAPPQPGTAHEQADPDTDASHSEQDIGRQSARPAA